jgi:hypothetical protein
MKNKILIKDNLKVKSPEKQLESIRIEMEKFIN